MTLTTTYLRPLNPKTGQVNWPSQKESLWRTNLCSFCFSLLRKVCPSIEWERERTICPQQEEGRGTGVTGTASQNLSVQPRIQRGGRDNGCTMADGKSMVHHHVLLHIIRPEKKPGHVYLVSCGYTSKGWRSPISMWTGKKKRKPNDPDKPTCIDMPWGVCAFWGPPTKVVCHLPPKK